MVRVHPVALDYKEYKINRQEIFKKYFLYTEESGSFIKWKALPAEKANVKVGEDAGVALHF